MQARRGSHSNPRNIRRIIYWRRQVSLLLKRFVKRAARKRIGDVTAKETGRERRKFMVESHVANNKRRAFEHVRCDRRDNSRTERRNANPRRSKRELFRQRRSSRSSRQWFGRIARSDIVPRASSSKAGQTIQPWRMCQEFKGQHCSHKSPIWNLAPRRARFIPCVGA